MGAQTQVFEEVEECESKTRRVRQSTGRRKDGNRKGTQTHVDKRNVGKLEREVPVGMYNG